MVNSVNENSVLIVDSNAYPFNILLQYGQTVDESTQVIEELEYLLASLSEEDRTALVTEIEKLLLASSNNNTTVVDPESDQGGTQ